MSTASGERADRIEELLVELKRDFLAGVPARLDAIEEEIATLGRRSGDVGSMRRLRQLFHNIAGLGGTHGLSDVTLIARGAEHAVERAIRSQSLTAEDLVLYRNVVDALRAIHDREHAAVPVGEETKKIQEDAVVVAAGTLSCDSDVVAALTQAGFSVVRAATFSAALAAIRRYSPVAVVTDEMLEGGKGSSLVELLRLTSKGANAGSIILSRSATLDEKVDAIRCGADACLSAPVDAELVARRIQTIVTRLRAEMPCILYVEDDRDHAALVVELLGESGHRVEICSDPNRFEEQFAEFHPDLVLMDINLSCGVNGHDLARYVRQDERNAALPILFVTVQGETQSRIETMLAGGDDQIVKPFSPALLLSTVSARLERSRLIKSLLEHDGLTGLLTHIAFHDRLSAAVAAAERRSDRKKALVMIDLDHFKSINDKYGHPAGDRVLAALGALITRRTRRNDACGRYGGEEFALLLEDADLEQAGALVERILSEFSAIEHPVEGEGSLRATFSAGVAEFRDGMTAEEWKRAADNALYLAKRSGRCQVVAASTADTGRVKVIQFPSNSIPA